jgi:hypothetical protein
MEGDAWAIISSLPQTEGPTERYCRVRQPALNMESRCVGNGSKGNIRGGRGFDTPILTARLESLIVVRRAGSPGYNH